MQSVIDFVMAHQAALAAVVVLVADLIIEKNPNVLANGILSAIYNGLKALASKILKPPQA